MDLRVEQQIRDCGLNEQQKEFIRTFVKEKGGEKLSDSEVLLTVRQALVKVMDAEAGL
jgi:hypothetical protein